MGCKFTPCFLFTREKKKKLVKLPGQPKRATSSYMLWMNANRDSIKNDNPGFSIGEIAKKAGEMWKALEDKSVGLFSWCRFHETCST